jgi:hypothetical protein
MKKIVIVFVATLLISAASALGLSDQHDSQALLDLSQETLDLAESSNPTNGAKEPSSDNPTPSSKSEESKQETESLKVSTVESPKYCLDEIICTIYGPERTRIICRSDLNRLSMDGTFARLNDTERLLKLIIDELLYQDALKYKIPIDESVIDNYIAGMQQQHGLTIDDVQSIFKASGFTMEEGREQLRIMYASSTMIELKVKQNLVIPEEEVIAYYNAHPETEEAAYKIESIFVPVEHGQTIEMVMQAAEEFLKNGKVPGFHWSVPFWLQESELAESLHFIPTLPLNEPYMIKMANHIEIYRVVERKEQRLVPLEKRYRSISDILRKPKFEKMYEEYKTALLDAGNATIVYYTQVS